MLDKLTCCRGSLVCYLMNGNSGRQERPYLLVLMTNDHKKQVQNIGQNNTVMPLPTFRFKRRELKYVIFNDRPVREIVSQIHAFFPVSPYKADVFPTYIQTTWCETPDWFSLREYLDRADFRYKLRVRRYGDSTNGWSNKCYVEIKTKTEYEKLSSKYRFMVPCDLIDVMFEGKDIRKQIEYLNRNVPRFEVLYAHVMRLITEQGYRPLLRAEYPRGYFQETKDDPVRLTLDGYCTFTYLPDMRSFKERFRLLESKKSGEDDGRLEELLGVVDAERVWRFSKYHRALKLFIPDVLERINSMI